MDQNTTNNYAWIIIATVTIITLLGLLVILGPDTADSLQNTTTDKMDGSIARMKNEFVLPVTGSNTEAYSENYGFYFFKEYLNENETMGISFNSDGTIDIREIDQETGTISYRTESGFGYSYREAVQDGSQGSASFTFTDSLTVINNENTEFTASAPA